MKLKGGFWIALFFLVLGLFGIVQSVAFDFWESMFLPLSMSAIIVVLSAVQMVKELRRQKGTGEAVLKGKPDEVNEKVEVRRLGLVFGWGAGFCLAIYLLGFYISILFFAFAFLKWRRRSWLVAAILAVSLLAITYVVFNIGLNVPLYKGLVFGA